MRGLFLSGASLFISTQLFTNTLKAQDISLEDIKILDESALNRGANPCDDFYEFACGGWIKATELPADKARYVRSFTGIGEQSLLILKKVLEDAQNSGSKENQKIADYYSACMNDTAVETSAKESLQNALSKINQLKKKSQLPQLLALLHTQGIQSLFSFGATQDAKDATQVIAALQRGDSGLPDRDYYLSQDQKMKDLRQKYLKYISSVLQLAGDNQKAATKEAKLILKIETALAKLELPIEQLRDPVATYNPKNIDEVKKLSPGFDFDTYLKELGVVTPQKITLTEPQYTQGLDSILSLLSAAQIRTYLKFAVIRNLAPVSGKDLFAANFEFYGKALSGQKEPMPRWKECVTATSNALPEALGQAYVALKFPGDSKSIMLSMIKNIKAAFSSNLETLDWMDAATKGEAQKKLGMFTDKIGYPDHWTDYSSLNVSSTTYSQNAVNAATFARKKELASIGKPMDRTTWDMSPQTVNAYYNPPSNEIVFPAGISQPPFFKNTAPISANYGAIGVVMGHELTHGFDDEGRQYDGQGNLKDWWSPQVSKTFDQKAQCIADQYSTYTVAGGVHLNGKLTLGENIADYGGVKLSHMAFEAEMKNRPPLPDVIGLNQEQQFFVGFAQSWCAKAQPQEEQRRAAVDPHSPPKYRVNGVLVNTPAFAAAFQCKEGAPMAPKNRCSLW